MFALDFLSVGFANRVLRWVEQSQVRAPTVRVELPNYKGSKQVLKLFECIVCVRSENVGEHCTRAMVNGVLQPALLFLGLHKAPHLIHFGFLNPYHHDRLRRAVNLL